MVDCSQFLEGYSAFRDGELDDFVRARFEAHRAACPSCARYDRVIDRGVKLIRESSALTPSEEFLPRLQHRLYHLEDEMRGPGRNGSGTQTAVTLALAATIAAIAWMPATRPAPAAIELPPVSARAPLPPSPVPVEYRRDARLLPVGAAPGSWMGDRQGAALSDLFYPQPSAGSEFLARPVVRR